MLVHVDKDCDCRVDKDTRQSLQAGKRYDIPAKEARRLAREGVLVMLKGKPDGDSV